MHSGEGEQGVQDIAVGRADPDDSRKCVSMTSAFPRFSAKPYVGICWVQRVKSLASSSCIWWLMEAT